MKMIATLTLAAALSALVAAPAAACMTRPEHKWGAIQAALPRANLSDADIARIYALRARAFAALAASGEPGKSFDVDRYHEAETTTAEAAHVAGLVWVPHQPPTRGCGGTYRLKTERDAH
jgi:hypothetical protein